MYTHGGTLAEVFAFLVGYDLAEKRNKDSDDDSVALTMKWLIANAKQPQGIVTELLATHGTDDKALQSIYDYATTLQNPRETS